MVDLHSHILPGLDDGAVDENMALEMLRIAANRGTRHIIATPHYIANSIEHDPSFLLQEYRILSKRAEEKNVRINVYPGNEAFICPELPQLLEEGAVFTLNGSRYLLIELPSMSIPWHTQEVIYQLRLRGCIPVIAHPERNWEIIEDPNKLCDLIERGALVQVNSTSITGLFGRKIKKAALTLLRHRMVHFISSDAHTCGRRSPRLDKCRRMVAAKFGENYAQELFEINGKLVLDDMHIAAAEPQRVKCRRHLLLSWFKKLSNIWGGDRRIGPNMSQSKH